jgi:hypothetical protein
VVWNLTRRISEVCLYPNRPHPLWGPSRVTEGSSPGIKQQGRGIPTIHLHLVPKLWITGSTPPPQQSSWHAHGQIYVQFIAIFFLTVPVNKHSTASDKFLCSFLQSQTKNCIHDLYFRECHWSEKLSSFHLHLHRMQTSPHLFNPGNTIKMAQTLFFAHVMSIVYITKSNIKTQSYPYTGP